MSTNKKRRDPYMYVDPDGLAPEEGSPEDPYTSEFHREMDKLFSGREATPEENIRQEKFIKLLDKAFDNWDMSDSDFDQMIEEFKGEEER